MDARVLWDADGVVALAKPAGTETISQIGGECLTRWARRTLGAPGLAPAHRLDRDTSGAQLFARDPRTLARLEGYFRHRKVEKVYLGLCLGQPARTAGVIDRPLSAWSGGRRPVRVEARGAPASTAYRVLAARPEDARLPAACRVAFEPREGRTHQIRVHAGAWGHPLLGDHQYGDRAANRWVRQATGLARQALHAWRISWPDGAGRRTLECPPPEDWRRADGALFGASEPGS